MSRFVATVILVPALLSIVSCGKEAPRPSPSDQHDGVGPTGPASGGDQKREEGKQAIEGKNEPQHPPTQISSGTASFRYYQRFSRNGDWDKGKAIPSETGLAIVRLLQRSELWSAEDHPELVVAWGTHPYLPGYAARLDVSVAGKVTPYVIRTGCGLFDVERDLRVVPLDNKQALISLLKALSDKGREKFWR